MFLRSPEDSCAFVLVALLLSSSVMAYAGQQFSELPHHCHVR